MAKNPGALTAADYAAVLALLEGAAAARDRVAFGEVVSEGLFALMAPVVSVSYNEMSEHVDRTAAVIVPDPGREWYARNQPFYEAHMTENPLLQHVLAHGSLVPAQAWTDVDPERTFESTALFLGFYAPLGIRSQLGFTIPVEDGSIVAVVVNRDGRAFDERDRALVAAVSTLLGLAHRHVAARTASLVRPEGVAVGGHWTPDDAETVRMHQRLASAGLTARQAAVVAHAAAGATTTQIARALGISPDTARKHLENAYRRLGVGNRVAAAAIALGTTPPV